jgi:hypothetical protein
MNSRSCEVISSAPGNDLRKRAGAVGPFELYFCSDRAQAGKPGEVILIKSYPGINVLDIAGAYVYADSTNKVQLAIGNIGAPTNMKMVSWSVNSSPTPTMIQFQFEGTNTPWVTNFPGSGVVSGVRC